MLLAQWMTGAGKSRLACEAHNAIQGKTLIVAPKMVMDTWETQQLTKWIAYEEDSDQYASGPPWWALKAGRKLDRPQPEIVIVSYGSLHKVPKHWKFDFLVFDELHYGIHGTSTRAKACKAISIANPAAWRLGLNSE